MGNLLRGSKIMNEDLILLIEKILGKDKRRISFTFKDLKPAIIFTFIPLIFEIVSVILINKKLFETISMLVFIVSYAIQLIYVIIGFICTSKHLYKFQKVSALDIEFDYINPNENKKKTEYKAPKENYNCSFASFMSPEFLAQFGWTIDEETEYDKYEEYGVEEDTEFLTSSPLIGLVNDKEINCLCAKYKIKLNNWLKLATDVIKTEEMLVA